MIRSRIAFSTLVLTLATVACSPPRTHPDEERGREPSEIVLSASTEAATEEDPAPDPTPEPDPIVREIDVDETTLEDPVVFEEVIGVGGGAGGAFGGRRAGRRRTTGDVHSRETYAPIVESGERVTRAQPLSTFSIDVDTASYANVRRFLLDGRLPPPDAVRVEEMINAFEYDDPRVADGEPVSIVAEVGRCPWNAERRLARIAVRGKDIDRSERPRANLVFLIDVSGSMSPANKLPLVKQAMQLLLRQLAENDKVAIVTYAGEARVALPPTPLSRRSAVSVAITELTAGGSTNGGSGIDHAYAAARESFVEGGVNRVILATDGDFNVGVTDRDALIAKVESEAKSGVFLTILGVGTGNLKDALVEALADRGNGAYHYLDGIAEAHRILVQQVGATLVTVAKDVKIQVEFNPARVASYRLIGYENRALAAGDFNDDRKDAGELGAGQTTTALYELTMADALGGSIDPLRYAPADDARAAPPTDIAEELFFVKVRYKDPDGVESRRIERAVSSDAVREETSDAFRFGAAVAAFGMMLRRSPNVAGFDYDDVVLLAIGSLGDDATGRRVELVDLARRASRIEEELLAGR